MRIDGTISFEDIIDLSFFTKVAESIVETCPYWKTSDVLKFLASNFDVLSTDISSAKGHGLIILRMCNEMIRRSPKSTSSDRVGDVLIILSKLFPLGERSGVNLRGDLNTENITAIEYEDASELSSDFYAQFWKLQEHLLQPVKVIQSNWNDFISVS